MNTSDKFYDFDQGHEYSIEPKYNREDLLDSDNNPISCDNCPDGRILIPYQQDQLICPNCMNVYNPTFDTIKHEAIETTIEEMQDTHSGTFSYIEETKHTTSKTKIRKKLDYDEIPQYVRDEIDNIHWRKGYKTINSEEEREKLSHTTRK